MPLSNGKSTPEFEFPTEIPAQKIGSKGATPSEKPSDLRTMRSGGNPEMEIQKWKARNGKPEMGNGKWKMRNGKWKMKRGLGGCPKPLLHGLKRSTSLRLRGANAPSATKPGPSVLSDLSRHVAGEPTLRSRFDALAPESIRVGPRFP